MTRPLMRACMVGAMTGLDCALAAAPRLRLLSAQFDAGTPVGAFGFIDLVFGQAFVPKILDSKSSQEPLKPGVSQYLITLDSLAGSGVR